MAAAGEGDPERVIVTPLVDAHVDGPVLNTVVDDHLVVMQSTADTVEEASTGRGVEVLEVANRGATSRTALAKPATTRGGGRNN